ncbi:PrsW family intramembrane metalloprotease [Halorussus halophilus]|uniref:PrsW family intramembrane metalloprotease n=1 Tax=Halorussus halophilus TaxID=2650975 RepID=UPI001300E0BF|nr:PrsW family intramembrane metalloprotease [Halorussus halophilus]
MEPQRDPVEEGATDSADLYDVATWEERSWLDRLSSVVYRVLRFSARAVVVLLALLILVAQFLLSGLAAISEPYIGAFVLLSVVPAFALAAYIWYADVTTSEPLTLLVGTFLLGVLFAGFAAIVNTIAQPIFVNFVPAIGLVLFFYLIVAPVEETVKWLAIRLYAFRSSRFDAVIDGAVYGAMAGLGFATIENAIYITQGLSGASGLGSEAIADAGQTAAVRLLAGPGHVIYSAFAGYYLGLAKFNRENAGPIAVKGLLIAGFIHATYNTSVTYLTPLLELSGASINPGVAFIAFVVVYDGVFGYLLYRKISRYRQAYQQTNMGQSVTFEDSEAQAQAQPEQEGDSFETESK